MPVPHVRRSGPEARTARGGPAAASTHAQPSGPAPLRHGPRLPRRGVLRAAAALPLLGGLPLLQACARGAAAGTGTQQAGGWLPPPPAMPGRLLVVDLAGVPPATQVALAIIQGLVNRRVRRGGEALYLLVPPDYAGGVAFAGSDARWLDVYRGRYGVASRSGSPADALALARSAGVRRYVVWDPDLPATINVANTLAWLHGVAAIAPGDERAALEGVAAEVLPGGLDLAGHGFRRFLDLREQGFSAAGHAGPGTRGARAASGPAAGRTPDDAYGWALAQLKHGVPGALALLSVGDLPGDATEGVVRWTPRDYAVATRAFCWIGDLNRGTPPALGTLFGLVAGRRATMFGWSNNESRQTILCSSHGVNFVGADTPGLPAENLSVHSAIRATARQRPLADPGPPGAGGVYASIVVTDGDNISVLIDFHEGRWVDAARGRVPVGWSLQGMAPSWTPGMAAHYFDSATAADELVAWLPFGYPDLPSFVGHANWPVYAASARAAMQAAGLRVGQALPHTGAVLPARASGMWDLLHGADAPDGFLLGYTFLGGYPGTEPLWVNARPVFTMGALGGDGATPAEQATDAITRAIHATTHRPLFLAVALANGTTYTDALAIAQATYPERVRFVLPGQLATLARRAWAAGMVRSAPLGEPAEYGPRDAYFLGSAGDGGSRSSSGVYLRGGVPARLRQAGDGGGWAYAFNVEGCSQASVEIVATGAGTVQVSGDGGQWREAATLTQPWGRLAVVRLDASALLPATDLYLRFSGAAGATLGVLDLSLWYQRVLPGAALPARPVAASASLQQQMQLPAANVQSVSVVLGAAAGTASSPAAALELVQAGAHAGDSEFHTATVGGRSAEVFDRNTASPANPVSYLYFTGNVPGWTFPATLYLTVEYYDAPAGGQLGASYNSPAPGIAGAYTSAGAPVRLGGAAAWKTHTWALLRADFAGKQNFGADLRLEGTAGVAVHRVSVSRVRP